MATKDDELIETIDAELAVLHGALVQVRNITKALEGSRDTLRFVRTVILQRPKEVSRASNND